MEVVLGFAPWWPPGRVIRHRQAAIVCAGVDEVSARVLDEWKKAAAKRRRVKAGVSSLEKTGFRESATGEDDLDQDTLQELRGVMEVETLPLCDFDSFIPEYEETRMGSQGLSTVWGTELIRVIGAETSSLSATARYRLFPSKRGSEEDDNPSQLTDLERSEAVEAVFKLAYLSGSTLMSKAELMACLRMRGFTADLPIIPNLTAADETFFPQSVLCAIETSPFRGFVVWRRGVGVKRFSGLLAGKKWFAVSERYLSWARKPMDVVVASAIAVQRKLIEQLRNVDRQPQMTDGPSISLEQAKRTVSRVTPAAKWKGSIADLALPTFVQEPTYERVLVFYGTKKNTMIEDLARNPGQRRISSKNNDEIEKESPAVARLLIMENVEWAGLKYYFPESTALPSVFDILRVDLITIAGLLTLGYQVATDKDDRYIILTSICSALFYTIKVSGALLRSFSGSNSKLTKLRSSVTLAKGAAAVSHLSDLALENQFAIASEAWFIIKAADGLTETEIAQRVEDKYGDRGVRIQLKGDVEWALGKLVEAGLAVFEPGEGVYKCK